VLPRRSHDLNLARMRTATSRTGVSEERRRPDPAGHWAIVDLVGKGGHVRTVYTGGQLAFHSLSQTLVKTAAVLMDLLTIVNVLPSSDTLNSLLLSGLPLI